MIFGNILHTFLVIWILLNVIQHTSEVVIQKMSLKIFIIIGEFSVLRFLIRTLETWTGKHCPWRGVETGHYFAVFLDFCWDHDFSSLQPLKFVPVVVVGGRGGQSWGLGVWWFLWLELWGFVQIFRLSNCLNKREPVPDKQHITKTVRPEPCGETPYDPGKILFSFVS